MKRYKVILTISDISETQKDILLKGLENIKEDMKEMCEWNVDTVEM